MKSTPKSSAAIPTQLFESRQDWHAWLEENHSASSGIWLQLAKKGTESTTVSYAEALEVALCYGWIDGQKQAHSTEFWLQKFTPRSARSVWSRINKEKAQRLIDAGKMKPSGLREIESAKKDGRWDAAYEPASKASVPDDLQAALDANARAKAFFGTLDSRNRFSILYRVQSAKKAETRSKRIVQFVQMLEQGKTLY